MFATLQLKFSQVFEGIIWKVVEDKEDNLLILEIRDDTHRKVGFSVIDLTQSLITKTLPAEDWWVSLLDAGYSVILVQRFLHRQNPDQTTLTAIDSKTGEKLWEREHFHLDLRVDMCLYGRLMGDQPERIKINLKTGRNEGNWTNLPKVNQSNDLILRPVQYESGSDYFTSVKDFLFRLLNVDILMGVDYLEYNKHVIISYYIQENTGLANYLLVIDDAGNTQLNEKMVNDLKGLGIDTFFILAGCLIFVRNRSELLSYQL